MPFITLYITHSDMEAARKVATHLLEQKLIACANFFPITSMYWWKGEVANADEVVSLVKTTLANWKKVEAEVLKVHPYETPCIMKMDVVANDSYEKWIQEET